MKGNKKAIGFIAGAVAAVAVIVAAVIGVGKLIHTHEYTTWDYDDTQHWKICEADGAESSHEDHWFDPDNDYVCECGYQHTHDFAWQYDDNEHWQVCTADGYQTAKTRHNYNGDGVCECGATTQMATLSGTVRLYRDGQQEKDYTGVTFTLREAKTNFEVYANETLDSKTGNYTVKVPAGDTAYVLTISKTDYSTDSIGFTAKDETLRDAELVYLSFAPTNSMTTWGSQDYSRLNQGVITLDNDIQVILSKDTYKTVAFSVTLQPDWNSGKDKNGRQGIMFRFMDGKEYAGVVGVQADSDKALQFDAQEGYSKWWCGDNDTELALADGFGWDWMADLSKRTDLKNQLNSGKLTLTVVRDGSNFYVFAGEEYLGYKTFPAKYANMECQVGFYYLSFSGNTPRDWHFAIDETCQKWLSKVPFGAVNAEVKKQKYDEITTIPDGTKITVTNVGKEDNKTTVTVKNGRIALGKLVAGEYKLTIPEKNYSYVLTIKPDETFTDPITIGYEAFRSTAGMENWGSVRNFNLQNQGIIVLNNDMQFVFSRDTFKGGSFTLTFQKDWNSANKGGRQGIAFRFVDPNAEDPKHPYAGIVGVQTDSNKALQFDANEGYAKWWNDAGVAGQDLAMAEGSNWDWMVDLQAEDNKDVLDSLNNGTLKVTVAREGATFYVFANGKYVGKKTFPDKYKDMPAEMGFYYYDFKGGQSDCIRTWDFDMNSDASYWINQVPFGTIDGTLYSKEYRGEDSRVPMGTKVTVADDKDTYTVTVGSEGEFKLKRIVSGYYKISFELNGKTFSRRVFVGEGTNSGPITCNEELFEPTETMKKWGYFNGDKAVDGEVTVSNDIQFIFSKNSYKDVALSLNLAQECADKEQGILVRFRNDDGYQGMIALRKQYYVDKNGKEIYKVQFSKTGYNSDSWKLKKNELEVADGADWVDLAFFKGSDHNRTDLKALADSGDMWLTVVRKGNTLYGYIGDELLGKLTLDAKYADMDCQIGFFYNFYPTSISRNWHLDLDVGNTKWAGSLDSPLMMQDYKGTAVAVPDGTEVTVTNGTNTYKPKVTNGKLELNGVVGDTYTVSFTVNGKNYTRTVDVPRGGSVTDTITCGQDMFATTESMKTWGTVRDFNEQANGKITLNNDMQFIFSKETYKDAAFSVTLQPDWNSAGKSGRQGVVFRFVDGRRYEGIVGVQAEGDTRIQFDGQTRYSDWWCKNDPYELMAADSSGWNQVADLSKRTDLKEKLNKGELTLTVARKGATFYVYAGGECLASKTFPDKYKDMSVQVGFYYFDFKGDTTRSWNFDLDVGNTAVIGNVDAPLQMQNYGGSPVSVPDGTEITVTNGTETTTVKVSGGKVKLDGLMSGNYTISFTADGKEYAGTMQVVKGTTATDTITCKQQLFAPTETMTGWGACDFSNELNGEITIESDIQFIFSKSTYKDVAFSLNLAKEGRDKEQGIAFRFRNKDGYQGIVSVRKQRFTDDSGKTIYKLQFNKNGYAVDGWGLKDKELDAADGSNWVDLAYFEGGSNNRTDLMEQADSGNLWVTVVRKGSTFYAYAGDELLGKLTVDPKYADMECEVGFFQNFYPDKVNHTWKFKLDDGNTAWAGNIDTTLQMQNYKGTAEQVPSGTEVTVANGSDSYTVKVADNKIQLNGLLEGTYTISFTVNGKNYVRTVDVTRGNTVDGTMVCGEDMFTTANPKMAGWDCVKDYNEQANGQITLNNDMYIIFSKTAYQDAAMTLTLQGRDADWKTNDECRQGVAFRFKDTDGSYKGVVGIESSMKMQDDTFYRIQNHGFTKLIWQDNVEILTSNDWQGWGIDNTMKQSLADGSGKLTVARKGNIFYVFFNGTYLGQKVIDQKYANMECEVGFFYCNMNKGPNRTWNFDLQTENLDSEWLNGAVEASVNNSEFGSISVDNQTVAIGGSATVTITQNAVADKEIELKSLTVNGKEVTSGWTDNGNSIYTYTFPVSRGKNTVVANFEEAAKSNLTLTLKSHKYGNTAYMPENTEVTLTRNGKTVKANIGQNGVLTVPNLYEGEYTVTVEGYLDKQTANAAHPTKDFYPSLADNKIAVNGADCNRELTLEYSAFAPTPTMKDWGTADYSDQNAGSIKTSNDIMFVNSVQTFKDVAFTVKLTGGDKCKYTQGAFIRFKDSDGKYQGLVTVRAENGQKVQFDASGYSWSNNNSVGNEFLKATGADWQDLVFFTERNDRGDKPLRTDLGDTLRAGNLELTLVRQGCRISVYVNGEYFGYRDFDSKYNDMECEVGFYNNNWYSNTDHPSFERVWQYKLDEDISMWTANAEAELKSQKYLGESAPVAEGTSVTVTGNNRTYTTNVADGKLVLKNLTVGNYTIGFTDADGIAYTRNVTLQKGANNEAIICGQDIFAGENGTAGGHRDFNDQANGNITLGKDQDIVFTKQKYQDVALTVTTQNPEGNWQKTNELRQGVAVRFLNEDGSNAGIVAIESSLKTSGDDKPAQLFGGDRLLWSGGNELKISLYGPNWWKGFNSEHDDYVKSKLRSGGLKYTILRKANTLYIFADGMLIGTHVVDAGFAGKNCQIGFYYTNLQNNQDRTWQVALDTDVAKWEQILTSAQASPAEDNAVAVSEAADEDTAENNVVEANKAASTESIAAETPAEVKTETPADDKATAEKAPTESKTEPTGTPADDKAANTVTVTKPDAELKKEETTAAEQPGGQASPAQEKAAAESESKASSEE